MKLWKKILLGIVGIIVLIMGFYLVPVTYSGRVIDAETQEPIEGAAVVAKWNEEVATITGGAMRVKDVKETLTDNKGSWRIRGPRGMEWNDIAATYTFVTGTFITTPPTFIVFRPGYCSWPKGFGIDSCREKMNPKGDPAIRKGKTVEIPRLENNRENRLKNQSVGPIYEGNDIMRKQKEFIRLLNIEREAIGIEEHEVPAEVEGEK